MTPQERFLAMLVAMVGEEELDELVIDNEWRKADSDPRNWGLDDDDMAEARTDYADVMN